MADLENQPPVITAGQFRVIRSYVGEGPTDQSLSDDYLRLGSFDEMIVEELRRQLTALRSDSTAIVVIGELTLNSRENMRQLQELIKDFEMGRESSGLDGDGPIGGLTITRVRRQGAKR